MIRIAIITIAILAFGTNAYAATKYFTEMESPVYKAKGNTKALVEHGATCIAQNTGKITNKDDEQGVVVSTIRYEYTRLLITYMVRGTLTFMAKNGRFKMRLQNIERMQEDTGGYGAPSFDQVPEVWGVGWEAMRDNIQKDVLDRIGKCVQAPADDTNW